MWWLLAEGRAAGSWRGTEPFETGFQDPEPVIYLQNFPFPLVVWEVAFDLHLRQGEGR
jgi:hypothetical protein